MGSITKEGLFTILTCLCLKVLEEPMLVPLETYPRGPRVDIRDRGQKGKDPLWAHNMGPIYEIIRATLRWFTVKIIPVSGSAKELDKKLWS